MFLNALVRPLAVAVCEANAFQMENFTGQKTKNLCHIPSEQGFHFKGNPCPRFWDLGLEYQCENKINFI